MSGRKGRDLMASTYADPVQVTEMWQATCDSCGWHSQPASPKVAVLEWARLHRVTCPLKTGHSGKSPPPSDGGIGPVGDAR